MSEKDSINKLFLQVLERGPPGYHQVVLGVLCALMRLGDFSSPAMRHFLNDALKTISKYLKVNNQTNKQTDRKRLHNDILQMIPKYLRVKKAINKDKQVNKHLHS